MPELLTTIAYVGYLSFLLFYSRRVESSKPSPSEPAFFDRRLFLHVPLAILGGILVLLIAKEGYLIHVPYLAAVLSGVSLGWLEPRKGWLLSVLQAIVLLAGYFLLLDQFERKDLAAFSVYGSVGLVLIGGLLGGVLKRKL
ncbi:hypothetical protein [Persicitalea jodogahamensis]|uniref:Uncharacterized protein n=1 Tax=Persicitalea jodogahamensis TaxID=402147 RepID=A0A8J3D306_9BACT|nr:hypothetical protein [Persicitalea jodogahamensis]GHB73456.1 hypothetical protein GCM10007390_29490 [Persicitalea jodogahamensis]